MLNSNEEFFYKKCNGCLKYLPLQESFAKEKLGFLGYRSQCKSCRKEYRISRKSEIKEYHILNYIKNKEKIDAKHNDYRRNNPEGSRKYTKNWRINNLERRNKYKKEYYHLKKNDPLFFLKTRIRNRTRNAFKSKGLRKSKMSLSYLGCTIEELKLHIEKLFQSGMNWNNHGKWHLDHIIPIAIADTEEDVYKLNHYTNLQPLWAEDNIKKGDTICQIAQ